MARRPSLHRPVISRRTPPMPANRSHAIEAGPGDSLHVGLLLPLAGPRGTPVSGPPREQAAVLLGHLRDVLAAAQMALDTLVRIDLQLVDLAALPAWEAQLPKFFVGHARPVTVVVQVAGLPGGATMGLAALAVRPGGASPAPAGPQEMDAENLAEAWDED